MSNLGFATKEHSREMKLRLLGQLSSLFRTDYAISMDEKKRQPVVYILGGGLMDPLLILRKQLELFENYSLDKSHGRSNMLKPYSGIF